MRRLVVSFVALVLLPQTAFAKAHLWKFTEVFSNEDGTVQFIEMFVFDPAGTAETKLAGHLLQSEANTFVFPTNLPNQNTFHTWILIATPAIRNLIRDDKIHQIYGTMQMGQEKFGMQTMNQSLARLVEKRVISRDTAFNTSSNRDELITVLERGTAGAAMPPPAAMGARRPVQGAVR